MHTRRAIALALAAAPLTAAAATALTPDPIFAAIEAHRAAFAVVREMEGTAYDEAVFNALCSAETDRLTELLAMTPTTPAGCSVMLRYVETYANLADEASESQLFSSWYEPIKDPAATLLGRIAAVLEQAGA